MHLIKFKSHPFLKLLKYLPLLVDLTLDTHCFRQKPDGQSTFTNSFIVAKNSSLHFSRLYQGVHNNKFVPFRRNYHFFSSDRIKLNVQTWIYFSQNWNWLVHASRSSTNFSFETYTSLYKLFLWNLFDLIRWVWYQCRTNTERRWTRNTSRPRDIPFNQDLKPTHLFLFNKI